MWRFQYPRVDNKEVFAYEEMVVPVGMTVTLDITADDVAHSWWIPKLGGKMDAIPGYVNKTWFKADQAGVWRGPVRRAVRAQPRQHAGARARGAVRRVPGVVRPAGRRHQGGTRGAGARQRAAIQKQQQEAAKRSESE